MGSKRLGFNLLLAQFLLLSSLFAADLTPVTITDFSPGLQTTKDPTLIEPGAAQDLKNVDVWRGSVTKRRGSVRQNSTTLGSFNGLPVRFTHEFPDPNGNFWLISVSSTSLYKSSDGGVSNTVLTSTYGVTATSEFNATNAFGKVRLTDGTTNWIVFDGSAVSVSTASPKGKLAEFYSERVWTADVASARSTLYASAFGNPEDWTDDGISDDDAFSTPIRNNNGYPIRCIKKFGKGMVIFKDFSMDLLTTNPDGVTFQLTPISNTIGTQHPKSVQIVDNTMIFLGADGYYGYTGAQLVRISDDIKPTVDSIRQLAASERSYTETSQAQFQSGTSTGVTPSITAGDIILSTWTDTDTTQANFAAGTSVDVDTTTVSGRLQLAVNNTNVANNSFESGSGETPDNWTAGGDSSSYGYRTITECSVTPHSGTYMLHVGAGAPSPSAINVYILDASNNVLQTTVLTVTTSWVQQTVSLSSFKGRNIKVRFEVVITGSNETTMTSDTFFCSGQNLTFYVTKATSGCSFKDAFGVIPVFFDLLEGGRSTIYNGSFTSRALNTNVTAPVWLTGSATYSANSHTLTFQTQSSSDGSSWDSAVSWTPGAAPTSAQKQYLRYLVSMATATAGTDLPYVDDVTNSARSASGRYLSSSINIGSSITSWGQFSGTSNSDGGSQTFELYTDTDTAITVQNGAPVASTFVSSQTITNGSVPTISTAAFAWIGSTHTITAATQNPSMSDFTLSWNEGGSNFPVASVVYQSEYLCGVAIDSTTVNDTILVYDRNNRWTKYKDLQPYSMTLYRQKPYYGDSANGYIRRFQADGILNDNGAAINAYWISKELDMGYPLVDKTIQRYYVTAEYEPNSDAVFEYGVNRGTLTSTTLDLDLYAGVFRKNIPPTILTYQKGISHRFKISDSDVDDTFNLLSVVVKGRLETEP